jgi:hypothetical protein
MPSRPEARKKFITFPGLCARWDCSHMLPERLLRNDPSFPKVYRFGLNGRDRRLDLDEVEAYERAHICRREPDPERAA